MPSSHRVVGDFSCIPIAAGQVQVVQGGLRCPIVGVACTAGMAPIGYGRCVAEVNGLADHRRYSLTSRYHGQSGSVAAC